MDRHNLWISVDSYKRKIFLKNEIKKKLLKALIKSRYMTYIQRSKASFHITHLPKISSRTFTNNRCFVSGRSQAVDRKTRTSRFVFRKSAYDSHLPGLGRAS
jgi:ribosomal protein S14